MSVSQELGDPRSEIDSIDLEILRLLNKRAAVALRVGEAKSTANASLCDPERESQVITRLRNSNEGPLDGQAIANVFQRVIDESLNLQMKRFQAVPAAKPSEIVSLGDRPLRVAFLGESGTFSETAAIAVLGNGHEFISVPNFAALYGSIASGRADMFISPLENSLVGSIQRCMDLLLESELSIVAEVTLPVSHFLIGPPGSTIESIESVESHPAALGQCERFFAAHPHLKAIPAEDTAGSVKRAVASGDIRQAAIGGRRAAAIYKGEIIRSHIEDHNVNFTKFILLSEREPDLAAEGSKVSLAVRLESRPGSLHGALRPFVRRGIDLTKIESRPVKESPDQFNFYMDLVAPERPGDLEGALDELRKESVDVRLLGRYPSLTVTDEMMSEILNLSIE